MSFFFIFKYKLRGMKRARQTRLTGWSAHAWRVFPTRSSSMLAEEFSSLSICRRCNFVSFGFIIHSRTCVFRLFRVYRGIASWVCLTGVQCSSAMQEWNNKKPFLYSDIESSTVDSTVFFLLRWKYLLSFTMSTWSFL